MMKNYKSGDLVVYVMKNKLGLVKRVNNNDTGVFVWYHMGGTCANTPYDIIKPITFNEALNTTFENEYAKASILERRESLKDQRNDTDDLIDERHIRLRIKKIIDYIV